MQRVAVWTLQGQKGSQVQMVANRRGPALQGKMITAAELAVKRYGDLTNI